MDATNIDAKLVAAMQETPAQATVEVSAPESLPVNDPVQTEELPEAAESKVQPTESVETSKPVEDKQIDEYGNSVEKQKVYTEDEVNRLIRDRLARGKYAEQQPAQPQYVPPTTQQQPAEEEDWQQQLNAVVDKRIEERQAKVAEQQWQQQESARQADFESKFTTGMNGYLDFNSVVAGKNITNSMLLATRNLDNPAAFVYGAAKMHAPELERISKIADPYVQAAEIGRLHEKMVKTKNVVSNAPKPLEVVSSDVPAKKTSDYPPLDERIHQYAKQKRR